jgi:hypothetical protein
MENAIETPKTVTFNTPRITRRASSLPLAVTCPSALEPGAIRIESPNDHADLGTAVHWLLSESIVSPPSDEDLITTAAMRFSVDKDELSRLFWWAWHQWREIRQWFPHPSTEQYMEYESSGVKLTGHVDVMSVVVGGEVRIADWKSGRLDSDYEQQIRAYCWLALQEYPRYDTAYGVTIRVRDRVTDGWRWTRDELQAWWDALVDRLTREDRPYNPGLHCAYCPRGATCPAKTALVQQAAECLLVDNPMGTLPDDPAERAVIYGQVIDQITVLSRMCDQARAVIKSDVVAAGGRMPIGDGRVLVITSSNRTEIAATPQSLTLIETLVGDDLPQCVSVSKSELEKSVKATVARGQKQHVWNDAIERLTSLGVVSKSQIERLEVRRDVTTKLIESEEQS